MTASNLSRRGALGPLAAAGSVALTTPAGAAALIQYILDDDLESDESYWHMTALRSAVAALNSMGAAVQS